MKYNRLGSTEMIVSQVGFGASVFNNFFNDGSFDNSPQSIEKIKDIINVAFQLGINYFDVAPWYGNAQYLLSKGLENHERFSYYLATKVGRYNSDKDPSEWFDYSYKRTIESVEESLKIFNTDYLDLVQIHDFEFCNDLNQIIEETLPALETLRQSGKIRYIGINSYIIEKIRELLEKSKVKIDTVLTFTHLTLDDTSFLDHIEYFREKKVGIINSSPLSMGLYTPVGAPKWHNAPDKVKSNVLQAFEYCKEKEINLTKLAFYFSASNSSVDLTVVSMSSKEIVFENINNLQNGLTEKEKEVLEEIRQKFFIPLKYTGFGEKEVLKYQEKVFKKQ